MLTFDQCVEKIRDEKRWLHLGGPIREGHHEDFHLSMVRTVLRCGELGLPVLLAQPQRQTIVGLGRNYLVDEANKDARITDLMQIDSDMGWEPDDLITLWASDKDVVGAVGRKKNALQNDNINSWAVRVLRDESGKPVFPVDREDGYMRLRAFGAAFMRIRMTVIRKMIDAYPELIGRIRSVDPETGAPEFLYLAHLFKDDIFDGDYLTEDLAFCERWSLIGGEVWVDPTIKLRHHGDRCWGGSLIEAFKLKAKEDVAVGDAQTA